MLSHAIPSTDRACAQSPSAETRPANARLRAEGLRGGSISVPHFTHRFDAKGRISIPSAFRQVLAKDGFAGVYAYPSLDAPALDCGGHALIAEIDALLRRRRPNRPPATRSRPRFSA